MKKILIIEDEKLLGEMYQDKFTHSGFKVIWASSAEEGMKVIWNEKPDIILLDILLPRANGISFVKWLREQRDIKPIPKIVAFSNYDEPSIKKEALKLGVSDYLIKTNYTPSEIVTKVEEILKKS